MILGFCGHKGSGKSTAAEVLREEGFTRRALADPLKEACAIIFNLTQDQLYGDKKEVIDPRWDKTPREIMQLFGTEVGRQIDEDVWIKSLKAHIDGGDWVVDDVRFVNEAEAIREMGGTVVGLTRCPGGVDDHQSEREMAERFDEMTDVVIDNANMTLEEFRRAVIELTRDL